MSCERQQTEGTSIILHPSKATEETRSTTLPDTEKLPRGRLSRENVDAQDLPNCQHLDEPLETISVAEPDDGAFPEGGLQAWLVVLGSFCTMFIVFGIVNSTAAFQDYLSSHQLKHVSAEKIAWIFSVELFLVFFCSIFVGHIFDAHGPRLLVLLGTVGAVVSVMLLGLCTEYWHFFLTYAILGGLSSALLSTPAYACINHFFERRRGLASGVATTAGSIGGVVIPLMLRALLPKIGFAWATRVLGFLLLAFAVPANIFLRRRLPPEKKARKSILPDLTVLKDHKLVLTATAMFLMEWGLFIPIAYISSYASQHARVSDPSNAGFDAIAILNAASFFGRWLPGLLSDKLGRFNVMISTNLLCSISIFCIWLVAGNSYSILIGFAIMFGFTSGSNLGLIGPCLGQLCKVERYGGYFGTAYFVTSFGTLTSIPIGGALLSTQDGRYNGIIIFAGAAYAAAMLCYTITRGLCAGWKLSAKF